MSFAGSAKTQKKLGIDRVMENKVEFGKYQKRALAFLALIDLNDGVELILMTIILPILEIEFILSSYDLQIISSIFYCGMFVGAYASGILADKFGRKYTILYSQLFQGLIAIYFSKMSIYSELVVLRLLYGIVYGFSLPLSTTLYSEISPLKQRGVGIVIINAAVGIGKIYGVLMAFLIMEDIHTGNWRLLVLISCVPCFLVVFGVKQYVLESPRYLLVKNEMEKLRDVLNKMIEINKKDGASIIDSQDESEFRLQNALLFGEEDQGNTKALFRGPNKKITIRIWICWFLYHTLSKGQLLIIPFIVGKTKKDLASIVFTVLGEVPAMVLACMIIDEARYFGRKKTLVIFFLIGALSNVACYYDIAFGLSLAIGRFCYREVSSMLYAYTTEVYQTNYRALGLGWATGMGRLGTCIMPFYLFPLLDANPYYPFLLFVLFCLICCYCSYSLPVDTTGRQLDVVMKEFTLQESRRQTEEHINIELLKYPSSIDKSQSHSRIEGSI